MIRLALGIIFAILTAGAVDGGVDNETCILLSTLSMLFLVWFCGSNLFDKSL